MYPKITIKIGRRGQITLPCLIRRKFGLQEGDHIAVLLEGDRVILHPLTRSLMDMRGSIPVMTPQDFVAIRRQVIAKHAKKIADNES